MDTSTFNMLVPLILIVAIMYFLMIRPQQQQQKRLRQMIDNLHRGDTVVTAGGIVGKVVKAAAAEDTEILIEIADTVQVKMLKSSITDVRAKTQPVADKN